VDIILLVVVLVVEALVVLRAGEQVELPLLVTVAVVVVDQLLVALVDMEVQQPLMDMLVLGATLGGIIMEIVVGLLTVVMETLVTDMVFYHIQIHHQRLVYLQSILLH
jgi:hypothetical protein